MEENFSSIDDLIKELSSLLQPTQIKCQEEVGENKFPFGFIVGNPRSGTTLFLQYLASLGCFSYPTNTLARFSYAPYLGALIQQMLFDNKFDPLDELKWVNSDMEFNSALGKSTGHLSTNEFQHFFRNYITNYFPEYIPEEKFNKIDVKSMKQGLASIEHVFQKPFVTKLMLLQYNLSALHKKIPNSIFFYLKRDPYYVMQSIYLSRINYFGDVTQWWSVKPKEYELLREKNIYDQIAGQVYYTDIAIQKEMEQIPENNKMIVYYEDFCNNPIGYVNDIESIYSANKCKLTVNTSLISNFKNSNKINIDQSEFDKLKKAYLTLKNNS